MHLHNYYKLDNSLWQMGGFVSDPKQIDSHPITLNLHMSKLDKFVYNNRVFV
jgi:hypothetical protein